MSTCIAYYGDAMDIVTVSPKYQVVIPKEIREDMDIKPGDKMGMIEIDGTIYLHRIRSIKEMRGMFPGLSTEGIRDKNDRY